jgi:hypothetical protein
MALTADEHTELERRVRSLKIRAEDARRARVILMLADGVSYSTIEAAVPCYRDYINRWRRRFLADRLEGLRARYRGQPPTVLTPAMEARVLVGVLDGPPLGRFELARGQCNLASHNSWGPSRDRANTTWSRGDGSIDI